MKKHSLRKLFALLMAAALLASMGAVAEESAAVEPVVEEIVAELGEVDLPAPETPPEMEVDLTSPDAAGETGEESSANATSIVTVSPKKLTMKVGQTKAVTVTFRSSEYVSFSSSNANVALCAWSHKWDGYVTKLYITALAKGSSKITITNTENSDTATITVKVKGTSFYGNKGKKDGKAKYRALLIGEESFSEKCTRNRGDVTLMNNMLKSVKGPKGGAWTITRKYDLSNGQVKGAINSAFKAADEDDVSLFFIATHGDVTSYGSGAGALSMLPKGYLYMSELAAALKAVPGKVIIIIESCGSGAGVFKTYSEQNALSNSDKDAVKDAVRSFDQAVIDAFAEADEGEFAATASGSSAWSEAVSNTGELRVKNKFYVLAASRFQEESWGTEYGPYNYFTKWLTDGIKTSGRMPADANKNGRTTLRELFKYISKVGDNHSFRSSGLYYYQHVQAYPKTSNFELFKR